MPWTGRFGSLRVGHSGMNEDSRMIGGDRKVAFWLTASQRTNLDGMAMARGICRPQMLDRLIEEAGL